MVKTYTKDTGSLIDATVPPLPPTWDRVAIWIVEEEYIDEARDVLEGSQWGILELEWLEEAEQFRITIDNEEWVEDPSLPPPAPPVPEGGLPDPAVPNPPPDSDIALSDALSLFAERPETPENDPAAPSPTADESPDVDPSTLETYICVRCGTTGFSPNFTVLEIAQSPAPVCNECIKELT